MLHFPQLSSGSVAQYPVTKSIEHRTVFNEAADGSVIRYCDADAVRTRWTLRLTGLSDAEKTGLEDLFAGAEGRLRPFVFVDPFANMLRWSEDLTQSLWLRDPLLQASEGRPVRLTNAGQTVQAVRQQVPAVAGWRYCLSALVRSTASTEVTLRISTVDGAFENRSVADSEWRRLFCSGSIDGTARELTVEMRVAAGAAVDVAELQLEAQPMPSPYKPSGGLGGVHDSTRFDQDTIEFTTYGPDNHETVLRLVRSSGGEK